MTDLLHYVGEEGRRRERDLRVQVCHDHGVDLDKLAREWDPRWAIEREQAAGQAFGPFHRQWLFENARDPNAVKKILARMHLAKEKGFNKIVAARQGFGAMDFGDFPNGNAHVAINMSTTETQLWDPAIFASLPIGSILGGKAWQIPFGGICGTTATPAISFQTRIGTNNSAPPTGTALGAGPTMTLGTITAPQPWYGQGTWGCRSIGIAASTATMTGNGFVIMPGAAAATTVGTCVFGGITIPTTIDQSIAQGIGVSMIWGTSSASNTITPQFVCFITLN